MQQALHSHAMAEEQPTRVQLDRNCQDLQEYNPKPLKFSTNISSAATLD
jgi:hypothetical protein